MHLTQVIMNRAPKADSFWRKRRIFKMSAHFYGRKRNCYSIAIRLVHRALAYSTKARKLKKQNIKQLWEQRIEAGCQELGSTYEALIIGLGRCRIALDRKSIANLAIWEPRTFKVAAAKLRQEPIKGLNDISSPPPNGVITRGML